MFKKDWKKEKGDKEIDLIMQKIQINRLYYNS